MLCFQGDSNQCRTCIWHRTVLHSVFCSTQGCWLPLKHLKLGVKSSPTQWFDYNKLYFKDFRVVNGRYRVCLRPWTENVSRLWQQPGGPRSSGKPQRHGNGGKGYCQDSPLWENRRHSVWENNAPLTHYNLYKKTYIITKPSFMRRWHWVIRGQRSFCSGLTGTVKRQASRC